MVEESAGEVQAAGARGARAERAPLEEFVRDGYREYFGYIVEDRRRSSCMRRNAGTIRAMFDEPGRRGLDDLDADLRERARGDVARRSTPSTWRPRWPAWHSRWGSA